MLTIVMFILVIIVITIGLMSFIYLGMKSMRLSVLWSKRIILIGELLLVISGVIFLVVNTKLLDLFDNNDVFIIKESLKQLTTQLDHIRYNQVIDNPSYDYFGANKIFELEKLSENSNTQLKTANFVTVGSSLIGTLAIFIGKITEFQIFSRKIEQEKEYNKAKRRRWRG